MKQRCGWAPESDPVYVKYHDTEWGVPVHQDRLHFEFIILEGAQAGLSWSTILHRRDGYRRAFTNFDPEAVARMTKADEARLLQDPGIIRNRLKVASAPINARAFLEIQEAFGSFDQYIWNFVDGSPVQNSWKTLSELPASTPLSDKVSKDLKKRGFKFVGTTIVYAHLQATGIVNDHLIDCFRREEVARMS